MLREEIEICPHCMGENIINWDVEKEGYKINCQHCGKEIMLCDACLHSDDNIGGQCDWSEDKGCWRQKKTNKEETLSYITDKIENLSDFEKKFSLLLLLKDYKTCLNFPKTEDLKELKDYAIYRLIETINYNCENLIDVLNFELWR